MSRTRPLRVIAAFAAALLVALVSTVPGEAETSRCKIGPGGGARHCLAADAYLNPFRGQSWYMGRTDMGVDYSAKRVEPIRAIGDAKVIGSRSRNRGWPGRHLIWYRLLNGDHKGDIIYVAEHLTALVPAGTYVRAGQRIGTAVPGGTGIEMGWATAAGHTRASPCYREGMATNSGMEMARFLLSLGAQTKESPGLGPNYPTGPLC